MNLVSDAFTSNKRQPELHSRFPHAGSPRPAGNRHLSAKLRTHWRSEYKRFVSGPPKSPLFSEKRFLRDTARGSSKSFSFSVDVPPSDEDMRPSATLSLTPIKSDGDMEDLWGCISSEFSEDFELSEFQEMLSLGQPKNHIRTASGRKASVVLDASDELETLFIIRVDDCNELRTVSTLEFPRSRSPSFERIPDVGGSFLDTSERWRI